MATPSPRRPLFRSKTVQAYIQSREKSILPRVVAPPVFALCWVVLTLLIVAGIIIWSGKVPVYVTGSGIVPEPPGSFQQNTAATAIILFSLNDSVYVRTGLPIQLQIGQIGSTFNARVVAINQSPLSPVAIHRQYGLEVTEPVIVVTALLGTTLPGSLYAGSPVRAQLQIGSQSLLSLFPVVNGL